MSAELVPDESTETKDNSITLEKKFTKNHMINLVVDDKQK
jgi:hypothetical protein